MLTAFLVCLTTIGWVQKAQTTFFLFLDNLHANILCLRFYYYTAGSGGAGPTILATSFLLLGEEVIAYNKGQF